MRCQDTIYNCIQLIANLSVLLAPFLPFSSGKIQSLLQVPNEWKPHLVQARIPIPEPEILFDRIDKKVEQEEVSKLGLESQ